MKRERAVATRPENGGLPSCLTSWKTRSNTLRDKEAVTVLLLRKGIPGTKAGILGVGHSRHQVSFFRSWSPCDGFCVKRPEPQGCPAGVGTGRLAGALPRCLGRGRTEGSCLGPGRGAAGLGTRGEAWAPRLLVRASAFPLEPPALMPPPPRLVCLSVQTAVCRPGASPLVVQKQP